LPRGPRVARLAVLSLIPACLIASANYILNEILDAPFDAMHPTKRHRGIPAGKVKVPILWVIKVALILGGLLLGVAALIRPNKPNAQKLIAYESGVDPVGDGWPQSQIRYYIYALLFVMFDVEAVFMFPWATQLEIYGLFGLIEMLIFVVILALGLLYAWRKKVLQWA
jgi:NADH-quinone oxidoreductase subunit A